MYHKKRLLKLLIIILLIEFTGFQMDVLAHPGRIDSNGGHTDRTTGEYHYHHGYPAHQHEEGIREYDYDDAIDDSTETYQTFIYNNESESDSSKKIVGNNLYESILEYSLLIFACKCQRKNA